MIVEASGPTVSDTLTLVPDDVRGQAGLAVKKCVTETGGVGGFVTLMIANLVNFVTAITTNLADPYRKFHLIQYLPFHYCPILVCHPTGRLTTHYLHLL